VSHVPARRTIPLGLGAIQADVSPSPEYLACAEKVYQEVTYPFHKRAATMSTIDRRRESRVNFSNAIGLLAAIIGLTATIHGALKYLSSSERSKKERLGAVAVVVAILAVVIGVSAGVSYATASTPVGQKTIPVPFVPTAVPTAPTANPAYPQKTDPTASPVLTPTPTPTPQLSPTSAATTTSMSTPTAIPEPTVTPTATQGP
jgi:hypothetical protein